MIFLSDDYVTKYSDVISYLLGRSHNESYSFDYIQKTIAYSETINEFEKSNVTQIAFSSLEKIYFNTFPNNSNAFTFSEYNAYGWCGYIYVHLFLKMQITFEALFYLIPFEEMLGLYHLYHEMSISQIEEYASNKLKHTMLDIVMKNVKISNNELAKITGISKATINALRYNKRDIAKLEADKLLSISQALNIKMETLLPSIHLHFYYQK